MRTETTILAASAIVGVLVAQLAVGEFGRLSSRGSGSSPAGDPSPSAGPEPAFLVGAGDIADCSSRADSQTAELVGGTTASVFTLGDNVLSGREDEYRICYDETWGAALDRTYPVIGNHDLGDGDGAAYFDYFGSRAGDAGYYSFDLGDWRVIVLNSQCQSVGGCDLSSPQGRWLAEELAAHPATCTLALWHQPLAVSSGNAHGEQVLPFWEALYAAGADLVINGHAHTYERFGPQDPRLQADPDFGIRQIVVGTGGHPLLQLGQPIANSEIQRRAHGVLVLKLQSDRYSWEFVPVRGRSFRDSGETVCHGRPPATTDAAGENRPAAAWSGAQRQHPPGLPLGIFPERNVDSSSPTKTAPTARSRAPTAAPGVSAHEPSPDCSNPASGSPTSRLRRAPSWCGSSRSNDLATLAASSPAAVRS